MRFKILLLASIAIFLNACDSANQPDNSLNISDGNLSVPADARILQTTTSSGNELTINVLVDGNTGAQMTLPMEITEIDTTLNIVRGNIMQAISDGPHTFQLIYILTKPNDSTLINVIVASTETVTATINQGATTKISIGYNLSYPDEDNDTYTNLDEFIAGTNPFDNGSHPPEKISVSAIVNGNVMSTMQQRNMTLSINVLIDNVSYDMQNVNVDPNGLIASGSYVLTLTPSTHSFTATYSLNSGGNKYPLFAKTVDQNIITGQPNVVDYQTITNYTDSDNDGVSNVDELLAGFDPNNANNTPPKVLQVDQSTAPTPPDGLKVACFANAAAAVSNTCSIVTYKGLTFWTYAFIDNRASFAILAFNASNQIVQQWEKVNANSIYSISPNLFANQTNFVGKANATDSLSWAEMDVSAQTTFKPLTNQYYYIQSLFSISNGFNECLLSNEGPPLDGTKMASCDATLPGQAWKFIDQNNGYFLLESQSAASAGLCLESNEFLVNGATNTLGGASFMASCANPSTGQLWKILPSDSADPHLFKLTSAFLEASTECLEGNRSDRLAGSAGYNAYMDNCGNYSGQNFFTRLH